MRTISSAQSAVLSGSMRAHHLKVEVKDGGGTWRDLTTYPGFNAVVSVDWGENVDEPHATADIQLARELDAVSLSPWMEDSALNRAFDPANSFSSLLALNREVRVSVAIVAAQSTPASGDWMVVFHGRIDSIDPSGETVAVSARDLGGAIADAFIQAERVYALAEVGGSPVSCRIWAPSETWVLNEYVIPSEARRSISGSPRFYKVTTAGAGGTTEPTWPTSSTVSDGSAVFTYQSTTNPGGGYDVEDIMQGILDDNGLSSVTLNVPSSPGWEITQYIQDRKPVLEAIRALALQIGWDVRYKWDSGSSTFKLTLFEPDRANTTTARTFSASDYERLSSVRVEKNGIRNKVRVIYGDASDRDPAGNPKRKVKEVSDSTSITAYGELFMEIVEGSTSQIDSAAEAETMAQACLDDLKEPTMTHEAELAYGFPWAELGDLYSFSANGRHYSTDQDLALFEVRHSARDGSIRTRFGCRGMASGGFGRWHEVSSRTRPSDAHQLTTFEAGSGATLAATPIVGGARLGVTMTPELKAHGTEFEYHVSASSGFAPDSSTLVTVSKDREAIVNTLVPGQTYYSKIVPLIRNSSKLARAQPSEQASFTAGRANSAHLAPEVSSGLFPYNGGFEHATGDLASIPPDHWTMGSGVTWGSSSNVYYGTDPDGGRSLVLRQSSSTGQTKSALFPIQRNARYNLDMTYKTSGANASVATFNVVVNFFKDSMGTASDTLASRTHAITNGTLGIWTRPTTIRNQSVPSDANFVQIVFERSTAVADYQIEISEVWFTRSDISQETWTHPNLLASWTNYGSSWVEASYMKDSFGFVNVRGTIKDGTTTDGTNIFDLPSGYRPQYNVSFPVTDSGGGASARVSIDTSGNVTIDGVTGNSWLNLGNIRFDTAW